MQILHSRASIFRFTRNRANDHDESDVCGGYGTERLLTSYFTEVKCTYMNRNLRIVEVKDTSPNNA